MNSKLIHNWFGVAAPDVAHAQAAFLIAWLTVIGIRALGTPRLPLAFTAILVFVDLALIAVLIGVLTGATAWVTRTGAFAFVFAGLGGYVYPGVGLPATGGSGVPLGRPLAGN